MGPRGGRKESGDEELIVMTRADDRSLLWKFSLLTQKYKIYIWALGAFLLYAGFGFKTPAQSFERLDMRIDSTNTRVSALEVTASDVKVLLRLRCMDSSYSDRQLAIAGLNCSRLGVTR